MTEAHELTTAELAVQTLTGLVKVASLLIRQEMALTDEGIGPSGPLPADRAVLDWAVKTAGHLFDSHRLWDYDLLSTADHAHHCIGYRHTGEDAR